jgi:CheY-like chemotaxis protein
LVVEDNLINQQIADELLTAEGAMVSLAANGQLGVDAVRQAAPQFDVVLMDIQMPVLDGYAATGVIRNELGFKRLPILAMTANAMAGDRELCMAAGMNEHVGKPFDMTRLVSLLIRTTGFGGQADPGLGVAPAPGELPLLEGLELKTALGRMAGTRSLYIRTAKDFMEMLDAVEPELQGQHAAGQLRPMQMTFHNLKGNAGTLGLSALARESARLEALCKAEAAGVAWPVEIASLGRLAKQSQDLLEAAVQALSA